MLFSSLTFIFIFLPLTLLIYYLGPWKAKNAILLLASLIFYTWGEPVYILLMLLSIGMNYFAGMDMEQKADHPVQAKRSLIFAVVMNLLILGFFKYYGFLLGTINGIFHTEIHYRTLALPIGISFYTFQELSYIVDIYRGKAKAQKNIISFALYISMFPQLIAGPIVRYVDIEKQLEKREITSTNLGRGVEMFIIGLAKKVILANSIGLLFEQISTMEKGSFSVLTAWLGCIAYAFQIYFDFSGYSDMAIGMGKMFGFDFNRNFNYPYLSKSITEFWRRWHISLSTWFKEYVYIPLGGNRYGTQRTILNLLIVWMLTGLWHGASWNFVFWGLYFGVLLIAEKYVWGNAIAARSRRIQGFYTRVIVLIGWVFFFSPSMGDAFAYLGTMFGKGAVGLADQQFFFLLTSHWLLLAACIVGMTPIGFEVIRRIIHVQKNRKVRCIVNTMVYLLIFTVSIAFLVSQTYNPFLYFRF